MSRYEQDCQKNYKAIFYGDLCSLSLHERITQKGLIEDYNWRGLKSFLKDYTPEWRMRKRLLTENMTEFKKFYQVKKTERQLSLF